MTTLDSARKARHERLVGIHNKALTLILHESRLVLDRTNAYLVTTSFLLAAYGVSLSSRNAMSVAIPVIGLSLSVIHPFLMARTIRALEFWRSTGALVEKDPDYWFPAKQAGDEDLDFLLARQRRIAGATLRQDGEDMRMGRPPALIMRLQAHIPDPNTIFSTWLPSLVSLLWTLALIVALGSVNPLSEPSGISRSAGLQTQTITTAAPPKTSTILPPLTRAPSTASPSP